MVRPRAGAQLAPDVERLAGRGNLARGDLRTTNLRGSFDLYSGVGRGSASLPPCWGGVKHHR